MKIVVMFCGPFYDGDPYHYGRLIRAVQLANRLKCILLICGDGTRGGELAHFEERARLFGVCEVRVRYNGKQNTLGDAISAAAVISSEYPKATHIYLVTDWYHMPRAWIRLVKKLRRRGIRRFPIPAPVLDHLRNGLRRLPGELRGAWHALIGHPQASNKSGRPKLYLVKSDRKIAS